MGFGVGICEKCGFIDYDLNLCSFQDGAREDYEKIVCEKRQLCPRTGQNFEKNNYVYTKYIFPNIRYISRRCNTNVLFKTIDWLCKNIEKEDTEPEKFADAVKIIKESSY